MLGLFLTIIEKKEKKYGKGLPEKEKEPFGIIMN
jgi:hypothetical protein